VLDLVVQAVLQHHMQRCVHQRLGDDCGLLPEPSESTLMASLLKVGVGCGRPGATKSPL
jgi:hypothetical protein